MRKLLSLLLTVCLAFCCLATTASAAEETEPIDSEVSLMYLYTNGVTVTATISGNTATYRCSVTGKSGVTSIKIYLYLYEYQSNGTWKGVDAASKTSNSSTASLSDTYSPVVSGRKYRAEAHVYVYKGSEYEYIEKTS